MATPLILPRMSNGRADTTVSSSLELEDGEYSPSLTEWEVGSAAVDESLTCYNSMFIRLE
jgi:hypothetical protein